MSVDAAAVRLVVLPVALIDIPVGMNESASAVRLVVLPVALVAGAIQPDLDAAAVTDIGVCQPTNRNSSDTNLPLALVFGTIFQEQDRFLNSDSRVLVVGGAPLEGWQLSQDVLKNQLIKEGAYHDAWVVIGLIINLQVVRVEGTIIVSYMK